MKKVILSLVINTVVLFSAIQAEQVPHSIAQVKLSFAPVVEKTSPAVVSIQATQVLERAGLHSIFDDPFFEFFFGQPGHTNRRKRISKSLGSGVIIRPDGVIITCYHVIRNAKHVKVKLSDHREYDADVVVVDKANDLAALRIKHHKKEDSLPYIKIRTRGHPKVGDPVLAMGFPFAVGLTVTVGIISASTRELGGRPVIQTDASVNPGNSGGALVDMYGELVGVPNTILSRTGASHGIGFALPSSLILAVLQAVDRGGEVVRPWSGALVQTVTKELASSIGMDVPRGVIVKVLSDQSPAAKSGLQKGDVITKINGYAVFDEEEFYVYFQSLPMDTPVNITFWRGGRTIKVSLTPTAPPLKPAPATTLLEGDHPLRGVTVENLSPARNRKYGLASHKRGVVITGVNQKLMFAGFRRGDIILVLNGEEIDSVSELQDVLSSPMRSFQIILERDGQKMTFIQR